VFFRANPRGTQELRRPGGSRQRGDWWIRWACPHGHLHREQIGPKSLAREESERRRIEHPCPQRTPKPSSYLLADVIDEYLKATKHTKRSHREDSRHGKRWKERFGGSSLEEISPADLDRVRTELLTGNPGDDVTAIAPATVNRQLAFLRRVFNIAIRDGKADRNPVAKLKALREPSGRTRYLADDEEERLLKALSTDEDRHRALVLLNTGLRKSEFLGLRWGDVDFKASVLTIPRAKNGESRHVPLNATVREILSRLPRPLDRSALVFPNSEGNHDLRWAEKTFPAAVTAAKIDDFRFHDLRHTFASRLAMESVDLLSIQELGGWKDLTMVRRYSHLSPSHRREAIERLVTRRRDPETAQAAGTE
jgi:integrase